MTFVPTTFASPEFLIAQRITPTMLNEMQRAMGVLSTACARRVSAYAPGPLPCFTESYTWKDTTHADHTLNHASHFTIPTGEPKFFHGTALFHKTAKTTYTGRLMFRNGALQKGLIELRPQPTLPEAAQRFLGEKSAQIIAGVSSGIELLPGVLRFALVVQSNGFPLIKLRHFSGRLGLGHRSGFVVDPQKKQAEYRHIGGEPLNLSPNRVALTSLQLATAFFEVVPLKRE